MWDLVGDPHHVSGVADLMLVTLEGEQLLLAEVKSEARATRGTGEFQLRNRTRPVFGLLANQAYLSLYLPLPRQRSSHSYRVDFLVMDLLFG